MTIKNQKVVNDFYNEMKYSHSRLSDKIANKDQLDHLGALITEYGKNIGGGDNSEWQKLYPSYLPIKQKIMGLKVSPPKIKGFDNFIKWLERIVNLAWALQLKSPPESDQILKQIWELCGEIAENFEADPG